MRRCLQLDVGNSSTKWRLLEGEQVTARGRYCSGDVVSRTALLQCSDELDDIWISSVGGPEVEAELSALLQQRWGFRPWFARSGARCGGLVNSYQNPSSMGVDRWLAMLGARRDCATRLCVVDAGSALTIDLVSAAGDHEGGYIIPGPDLMERALLLDTDRVRFAEEVDYKLSPGTSTAEAVRHGIALAQAGAVVMALQACGEECPALYFCGGAGQTLMELLGRGGVWRPDLVFEGLEIMAGEEGRLTES